jgi:hypothetical protein
LFEGPLKKIPPRFGELIHPCTGFYSVSSLRGGLANVAIQQNGPSTRPLEILKNFLYEMPETPFYPYLPHDVYSLPFVTLEF